MCDVYYCGDVYIENRCLTGHDEDAVVQTIGNPVGPCVSG